MKPGAEVDEDEYGDDKKESIFQEYDVLLPSHRLSRSSGSGFEFGSGSTAG